MLSLLAAAPMRAYRGDPAVEAAVPARAYGLALAALARSNRTIARQAALIRGYRRGSTPEAGPIFLAGLAAGAALIEALDLAGWLTSLLAGGWRG